MASASEVESMSRAVVAEFCSYGIMFTALDVSNEVKARISGVRHREVSPHVRSLFEQDEMGGDYTRSSINVHTEGGKVVEAYLYHREGRDTAEYGQRQRQQRAVAPVIAAPARSTAAPAAKSSAPKPAPAAQTVKDTGTDTLTLHVAADGTAALPRSFLERAGICTQEVALDTAGFGSGLVLTEADEDEDEDEQPLELLEYESGDALVIPASYLSAFGSGARIEAHIERGVVRIGAA